MRFGKCTQLLTLLSMAVVSQSAMAEASEVRVARQFGLGYLPLMIMENEKLIEKHAKLAGLPDIKVNWASFAGASVMNDALLSNSLDFAAVGTPSLPIMWSRTKGTPQETKGVSAMVASPLYLNTRNPDVKSIKDLSPKDRIALPAVKVSIQALVLQMAAAKEFGVDNAFSLDKYTVSRSHPDAMAALLSGKGDINGHFTWAPFQYRELNDPNVRTILNSYDVLGGPTTTVVVISTKRFHDANPKLYKAFLDAQAEADQIITSKPELAAQIYLTETKDKDTVENIVKMIKDPQVRYSVVPENISKYTDFMLKIGTIKQAPTDWKEMFFPEVFSMAKATAK